MKPQRTSKTEVRTEESELTVETALPQSPNRSEMVFHSLEELRRYLQSVPEGQFISITLEHVTSDNEFFRGIEKDVSIEDAESSENSNKIARKLQSAGEGGFRNESC